MLVHANGECDPDRPADLPEPLALITEGFRVSMGLPSDAHHESCTPRDREEGRCDCAVIPLHPFSCEGCGDSHHGKRHAMELVREVP